jgi:GNAT superfamily N-acetyltransferase
VTSAGELSIRRATKADLPRIVDLLGQLSIEEAREDPAHDYLPAFEEIEADPRQTVFVGETAELGVIATLTLILIPNLSYRGRPYAVIENVVVSSEARGVGVGERIVMHAVQLAREAGCYRVGLTSNNQRLDTHRFYRRLGFVATHEGFKYQL